MAKYSGKDFKFKKIYDMRATITEYQVCERTDESKNITYNDAMRWMVDDEEFREEFISVLKEGLGKDKHKIRFPYDLEVCPVNRGSNDNPFKFVLKNPENVECIERPFKDIVPPKSIGDSDDTYANLSNFMASASHFPQQNAFLRDVALEVQKWMKPTYNGYGQQLWLSSHIPRNDSPLLFRLDTNPKYSTYPPYQQQQDENAQNAQGVAGPRNASNYSGFYFEEIKSGDLGNGKRYTEYTAMVTNQANTKGAPITYKDAMILMEQNSDFRNEFFSVLQKKSEGSIGRNRRPRPYFFEVCPVTQKTFSQENFRFALIDARALENINEDDSAFNQYFKGNNRYVVSFQNLGGDATMVVPRPLHQNEGNDTYAHISNFMSLNSSQEQLHEFWISVAKVVTKQLEDRQRDKMKSLWLSTCGTGVYWLHVRLDARPKYYSYRDYC